MRKLAHGGHCYIFRPFRPCWALWLCGNNKYDGCSDVIVLEAKLWGEKKSTNLLKYYNAIVCLGKNCLARVRACIDWLATGLEKKKAKSKWKLVTQKNVPGVRGPLGVKRLTPRNKKLLEMFSTLMNYFRNTNRLTWKQRLWVHPA